MVKTEKASIYHNVKLLAYRNNINLYQLKDIKRGVKLIGGKFYLR